MNKTLSEMTIRTSLKDLVTYVRMNGIDNSDIEATNKMADIIGNHTAAELAEIAKADQNTTFFLLKFIWPIIDIIRFYNEYFDTMNKRTIADLEEVNQELGRDANKLRDRAQAAEAILANLEENKNVIVRARDEYREKLYAAEKQVDELVRRLAASEVRSDNLDLEVLKLKAQMFDNMTR